MGFAAACNHLRSATLRGLWWRQVGDVLEVDKIRVEIISVSDVVNLRNSESR
jgi:hypothetical protein